MKVKIKKKKSDFAILAEEIMRPSNPLPSVAACFGPKHGCPIPMQAFITGRCLLESIVQASYNVAGRFQQVMGPLWPNAANEIIATREDAFKLMAALDAAALRYYPDEYKPHWTIEQMRGGQRPEGKAV